MSDERIDLGLVSTLSRVRQWLSERDQMTELGGVVHIANGHELRVADLKRLVERLELLPEVGVSAMTEDEGRCAPDAYGVNAGREKPATCPGCGMTPGARHEDHCDVSRCPKCGIQAVQCGEHLDAGQSIWTGRWPGEAECQEWNWWTTITHPSGKRETVADLNRLIIAAARGEIHWDVNSERYHR